MDIAAEAVRSTLSYIVGNRDPVIDFFDTSTRPTPKMLDAMRTAPVGDDVYGEDPTVRELEAAAAGLLGTDAALFVPSGTMANLIAVMLHARNGEAVIGEARTHLLTAETGGVAAVAGVMPQPVFADRGVLLGEHVEAAMLPDDVHRPTAALAWIENTHNVAGGTVTTPGEVAGVVDVCRRHGLALHIDGARLFNAAVALGVPVSQLTRGATSVTIALSKGLGAPVGSLLAASRDDIARARRVRKMLGGAMRQAGVVAAAGLLALRRGVDHLAEDHARARRLAAALADVEDVDVDPLAVETNIVIARFPGRDAHDVVARLRDAGVKVAARPPDGVRLVTHRDLSDADVSSAVAAVRSAVTSKARIPAT